MSVALLFAAPVFAGGRVERAIRWLFVAGFVLAVAAFVGFWLVGGDLVAFEVAVLSINWIVLIASGALLAVVFRRAGRSTQLDCSRLSGRADDVFISFDHDHWCRVRRSLPSRPRSWYSAL